LDHKYLGAALCYEAALEADARNIQVRSVKDVVHNNVFCNGCSQDTPRTSADSLIVGYRYKCVACLSFDLCGICFENRRGMHVEGHDFVQIPRDRWVEEKLDRNVSTPEVISERNLGVD
jgi:hypothetical protein